MGENIALFDLDGTLADFDKAMERAMFKLATPEERAAGIYYPKEQDGEPEHISARRRIVKRVPGFWRDLEVIEETRTLLFHVLDLGYRVSILTKGPRTNLPAWTEKVQWCHAYLPMEKGIDVNIVEDKGLVYGSILVDDWPPYIERWLAHRPRGWVIMPSRTWNSEFNHPRMTRFDENLGEVLEVFEWRARTHGSQGDL